MNLSELVRHLLSNKTSDIGRGACIHLRVPVESADSDDIEMCSSLMPKAQAQFGEVLRVQFYSR